MNRYRPVGWRNESHRHSLASKGIRTSFVANSRKGWRSTPTDLVYDEKKGKFVDWRKRAAAMGIKTGNKRRATVGDTFEVPIGVDIYEGMQEEAQPAFTSFESLPRQVTLPTVPPIVQEVQPVPRMIEMEEPSIPVSQVPSFSTYESEQQAQPVEEELPLGVSSPPFISKRKKQETVSGLFLPDVLSPEETLMTVPRVGMVGKRRLNDLV